MTPEWITFATVLVMAILHRRWARIDAKELAAVLAAKVALEAAKVAIAVEDENRRTADLVVAEAARVAALVAKSHAELVRQIDINTSVSIEALEKLSHRRHAP